MNSSASKGNNPELWEKLLKELDQKLQLGLLDHLERATSYHIEEEILYIEPANKQDHEYLTRDTVFQQLQILAHDAIAVEKVKLKPPEE